MAADKQKNEKAKYADRIRQLIPVNELSQDIQHQLINEASLITIRKKGTLFKQGDRDNFSYFLLDGRIELQTNRQVYNTIVSGTEQARYAMAQLQPRQFTGIAAVASVVLQLSRDSLDRYLLLSQEKSHEDGLGNVTAAQMEVAELDNENEDVNWMVRLLQSDIFARMPTANIHQLFALLEPVEYKAGDVVVSQGEPGEDYYIIQEGRCEVSRKPSGGGKSIKLAELSTGDSFGEEALLAETTRNATVSMATDGILMRLSKQHFDDLIKNPTLHAVAYEEADTRVRKGEAKWLDIRYQNEHQKSAIEGSMNIPSNMLRMQMDQLDRDTYYILYCDTGGRSSAAAFLLAGSGFEASYLKGGLVNNPEAAHPTDVTDAPESEGMEEKEESKAATDREKRMPGEEELDSEIKASYLETELTRTNLKLENTQGGEEEQDAALKKKRQEEQKRLEEEREKLQADKRKAEERAQELRKQEEEKLKKLESEAKSRIEEEKKRLEEIYSRNVEEMEKLNRMKKEAEEKAKREREQIEKQAVGARDDKTESERLKKELEASRLRLVEEEKKRKKQQEEMEQKIQMQARQKLEEERKKMALAYAHNNEELEKAKRERAAAEAAREAAKKEAEEMIAEYKAHYEKSREEVEQRLREERRKLEEDQRKIQETLKEVHAAREEAEAVKKAARDEIAALKEKHKQALETADKTNQDSLKNEIKQAEAKLYKAKLNIAQSQQQSVMMYEQKRTNEQNITYSKEKEEEIRQKLEADLAEFKEELEEEEKERAGIRSQVEHLRRIRERAEAAKREAQNANADLLSDIEKQLGDKK